MPTKSLGANWAGKQKGVLKMSISCKFCHINKKCYHLSQFVIWYKPVLLLRRMLPSILQWSFLSLQCHFNAFMHLKECKQLQEFLQLKVIEECLKQLHHVVYIFRSKYQKNNIKSKRKWRGFPACWERGISSLTSSSFKSTF